MISAGSTCFLFLAILGFYNKVIKILFLYQYFLVIFYIMFISLHKLPFGNVVAGEVKWPFGNVVAGEVHPQPHITTFG